MSLNNQGSFRAKSVHSGSKASSPTHNHGHCYDKTRIQRMYQYPAIMKDAQMHKKANEFGYNAKTMGKGKAATLCPCCQLPVNTVRIDMSYGTTPKKEQVKAGGEIFLLNAGSAMFFTFIKMAIVYLLLRFLISDCYNLITNTNAKSCDDVANIQHCKNNVVARFSSYNKGSTDDEPFLYVVDILNLAAIVCSIIFFLYYRRYQYEIYEVADVANVSQSDFTIFAEEIPIFLPHDPRKSKQLQCQYEQDLKDAFQTEANKWIGHVMQTKGADSKLNASFYKILQANPDFEKGPIVNSVTLCFDLTQMEKLNTIRSQLMREHNENVKNNVNQDQSSIYYIPNQIECINSEYIELSQKFAEESSIAFNLSHFVGKGFISFQYEHIKEYFLQYCQGQNRIKVAGRPIKLTVAAQPSDVYWFNMKISQAERRNSIIYSYLIMFLALAFSFALLFGLQYYQLVSTSSPSVTAQTKQQVIFSYIFTITMTTLTTAINYILAAVCQKLSEWQKHKTKTDYIISLMVKSILSQFLNTAFIYYVMSVVSSITAPNISSPLSDNGLVMKVTSLVAVSGCIQIATNAFQFGTIFSCLVNKFKYSKKQTVNMFQVELNHSIQDPEFDFSDKYAYYIVNVYVVSFFSYITPYISIILALIFFVQYWVDKYNLFQRFSCPTDFNFRLSRTTLKTFEVCILVFALGNYIFSFSIHPSKNETQYHIINLISLLLAIVYCLSIFLLPKRWFERIDVESYQTSAYTDVLKQEGFNKVYWLSNPATSFAQEPDLNDSSKFVNYGQTDQFANASEFDEWMQNEQQGKIKAETYDDRQVNLVVNALQDIQFGLGDIIKGQNEGGDNDIMARIAKAGKI